MKTRVRIAIGFLPAVVTPAIEIVLFRRLGDDHPLPIVLGLLVLTAAMIVTWIAWRLGWRAVGFGAGRPRYAAVALLYPLVVLLPLVLTALISGNTAANPTAIGEAAKNTAVVFLATILGVVITEEGFFRGTLYGGLRELGMSPGRVVMWTTIAFASWHIYVPLVEKDFFLPAHQIPVYYTNVLLIGGLWGLARAISGSMLVPCVAHASWNALVYTGFGHGEEAGVFGIHNTFVFGAERGMLGILVNALALWWLYRIYARRSHTPT